MLLSKNYTKSNKAFALPTILISSLVMLLVLVAAISSTASISAALKEQGYNQLATAAGNAGMVYAQSCLQASNGSVTWTVAKPLKPNTDCSGNALSGVSPYVLDQSDIQTYFVVTPPDTNGSGVSVNIASKGYIAVLRTSTGLAWRIFSSNVALAIPGGGSDMTPPGTSIAGYWSTAPTGYLLEDGSAVSRTTYSTLFSVIGTTFGAGDGSTTFNLPDSRGRVLVNKNPSDTQFDTLGEKYGEKTHTLTIAEMPSHTHIQDAHNHTQNAHTHIQDAHSHNFNGVRIIAGSATLANSPAYYQFSNALYPTAATTATNQYTTATNNPTTATNQYTGGGGAHNVIQPSITVNRAIKY